MSLPPASSENSPYVQGGGRLDQDPATSDGALVLRCFGYLSRNRRWMFARVFSPFWRLYYNFAPGHHIVHAGHVIRLTPERLVIIPENVLFHCVSPGGAPGHLYLHFNLGSDCAPALQAPLVIPADGTFRAMARELARSKPESAGHLAAAVLHRTLGRLSQPIAKSPSRPLQQIVSFVAANLGSSLANPILARKAGVSRRNLDRLFREELQISPQRHVRETRLREAARRLAHGNDTIDQIAGDLGFSNRNYFTRQFGLMFDCAPGRFRRRIKDLKPGAPQSASH